MTRDAENRMAGAADLHITRTFAAPRDLVYRVWTDPRYVALWWGIGGSSAPVCEMDVRRGGTWRIDMRTASGTVYPNHFEYVDVVDNERLVYVDLPLTASPAWTGSHPPSHMIHTVTFEDEGAGTKVTLATRFTSEANRDRILATGIERGIAQSLDRLGRLLAKLVSESSETGEEVRP